MVWEEMHVAGCPATLYFQPWPYGIQILSVKIDTVVHVKEKVGNLCSNNENNLNSVQIIQYSDITSSFCN